MRFEKLFAADYRARIFDSLHTMKRYVIHTAYTFFHKIEAKMMGVSLGTNVSFNGHITIDRFKYSKISIGNNVIFNSHSAFNPRGCKNCILKTATDSAIIEIGDGSGLSGVSIVSWNSVIIGRNVMIGADTCIGDTDDHPDRLGTTTAPVKIGDNVFIGMHCLILKGVTIGDNAIIGAGSVVTKDIPAGCRAVGVPCKEHSF